MVNFLVNAPPVERNPKKPVSPEISTVNCFEVCLSDKSRRISYNDLTKTKEDNSVFYEIRALVNSRREARINLQNNDGTSSKDSEDELNARADQHSEESNASRRQFDLRERAKLKVGFYFESSIFR